MDHRGIVAGLLDSPSRAFDVELWDKSAVPRRSSNGAAGRIIFRTPRAVMGLAPPAAERRAAEAFVEGDIEIVGDTVGVLEAVATWQGPRFHVRAFPLIVSAWVRDAVASSKVQKPWQSVRDLVARDAQAARHHYDVSNEFYRLFLDRRMVYSCAYFARGDESIDQAQDAKIELACRKINLQPKERLLDIGCGWGGLLVYAAEHFGVQTFGTTLSRAQFSEARRVAMASSASAKIHVFERDYRQVSREPFDKVVSIGMMEHVGGEQLDDYFAQIFQRMRPGGLFLNHAIADIARGTRTVPWLHRSSGGFIDREIFPDCELPPLGTVIEAAERQGFEVRDVECLREHYARTLGHWVTRLEQRFDEAVELVGARTARAWRLYLAASAVAFRLGRIGIYQTLLAKRTERGEALGVPQSRRSWCEPTPAPSPLAETA